jgi:C4-dicarboxylate-specific signal transduction histidine kinase
MITEMRKTGLDVVGDMPWGTHVCLFYESKSDLLETLVSYCQAGLESEEFCLWVVAAPVTEEDAGHALRRAVPDFDRYVADHSMEIVAAHDWYLQDGTFDLERVISGWNQKLARASARGYAGVRVTGDTAWLEKKDWKDFCEYEDSLNESIANQRLAVLCTYPLAACGAGEILDVVRTHQFAIARRRGSWDVIETAGHKQAKAEIKRLNGELEQRVEQRTRELLAVNEELTKEVLERHRAEERAEEERERLRQARADLAHISRVTTMGELTASLAHEIKQPISAAVTDAHTCVQWLGRDVPDLDEAREAASRLVKDVSRAAEIIGSISSLFKKGALQRQSVDVNELIRDMTVLLRSEAKRCSISVRTELAAELPHVLADAVQLQQVFMNLMLNGIDAMKGVTGAGELTITSQQVNQDQLLISISDTGVGVPEERVDEIFDAFFTTKPHGIGMGLPISRSIIESHGGRLWAAANSGPGASFQFVLPAEVLNERTAAAAPTEIHVDDARSKTWKMESQAR